MTFLAGAAVGYVLGTKAGRDKYEQIKKTSRRVAESPTLQEAAGVLRAKGEEIADVAKGKATHARERVPDQIGDRLPRRNRAEQEHPESVT